MRLLLTGLLLLGSLSTYAQEMDMLKCSLKVDKAIKAIASLEIGKDVKIVKHAQDTLSTATNMIITVVNVKKPAQLIYTVKTIDISEDNLCVISNIDLR